MLLRSLPLPLVMLVGLASCGADEYVLLSLESLRTDAVTIDLETSDPLSGRVLGRESIDVAKHGGFPLEVLFTPSEGVPHDLRVAVTLAEDTVIADYSWVPGKVTHVHVDLDAM